MEPAIEHVKFAEFTVPVFDYMLGGEVEQLELVMRQAQQGQLTDYQNDLECFLICARHRVEVYRRLTREDFSRLKFGAGTRKSLREKVSVLIAPFAVMQRELSQERGLELLKQLTPEKMMDAIQAQELLLSNMKLIYTQAIGVKSATDSSRATA